MRSFFFSILWLCLLTLSHTDGAILTGLLLRPYLYQEGDLSDSTNVVAANQSNETEVAEVTSAVARIEKPRTMFCRSSRIMYLDVIPPHLVERSGLTLPGFLE